MIPGYLLTGHRGSTRDWPRPSPYCVIICPFTLVMLSPGNETGITLHKGDLPKNIDFRPDRGHRYLRLGPETAARTT